MSTPGWRLSVTTAATLVLFATPVFSLATSQVVQWGYYWEGDDNGYVPIGAPPEIENAVAVAGGMGHSLALRADGTVVVWGDSRLGQTNVPPGLENVVAIAAGDYHSLALRSDGSVVAWGDNSNGQTAVPADLTNAVAVSAAYMESLALRADGTVVAWGGNSSGQSSVPASLSNVVAIASSGGDSAALKADGEVLVWGDTSFGQTQVPTGLTNAVAIASSGSHMLAMTADGRILGWGQSDFGLAPVPGDVTNVAMVAAGNLHILALRKDGTVVAWGAGTNVDLSTGRDFGQCMVPPNLTNVTAIGAGQVHSLASMWAGAPFAGSRSAERTLAYGSTAWLRSPATGAQPMSYQWRLNGGDLPGARQEVLELRDIEITNSGDYAVVVSNHFGSVTCSDMVVKVTPFFIVQQPLSQVVALGLPATFGITVAGRGPFQYQWLFNDQELAGATNQTLVLTNVQPAQVGTYSVLVSNLAGIIRSAKADLSMPQIASWGSLSNVPPSLTNVVAIAAGLNHSLAVNAQGTVTAWGQNQVLQTNVPAGLNNMVAVVAGSLFDLALKQDGTVVQWGNTPSGDNAMPLDLTNAVAIAAGSSHALALRSDGRVVLWGNYTPSYVPVGLTNVVAIAAGGDYSLALRVDGTVIGWPSAQSTADTVPSGLSNVIAVAVGQDHRLALKSNGTITAWGGGLYGQSSVPTNATNIVAIAAGAYHSLALRADGLVIAWGAGSTNRWVFPPYPRDPYQCGQSMVPAVLTNAVSIAGGRTHSLALLGAGPPVLRLQPTQQAAVYGSTVFLRAAAVGAPPLHYQWRCQGVDIPGATNAVLALPNVQFEQAGGYSVVVSNSLGVTSSSDTLLAISPLFISEDPQSRSTYRGDTITLGVGVNSRKPISYQWLYNGTDLPGATNKSLVLMSAQVSQSGNYSVTVSNAVGGATSRSAVVSVGRVIAWGDNSFGQTNLPPFLTNVAAVAAGEFHNLVLKGDGSVGAWGANSVIGITTGQTAVPVGLSNVIAVAGGSRHSLALRADGTVIAWGQDELGRTDVPTSLSNAVAIAAGSSHSLALKADSTVVAWGDNQYHQASVPLGLSTVVAITAGDSHSVALKADGTVAAWGDDGWGESDVPAGLSDVVAISAGFQHTVALKADGTLTVWGATYANQTNVPPGLSNVVAVSAGGHHTLALQSDGRLITFGDTTSLAVPAAVTNVMAFAAGGAHNLVLVDSIEPVALSSPAKGSVRWLDGTFIIDLDTVLGTAYTVQFSSDLADWRTAGPVMWGTGARLTWTDDGPPKTPSRPAAFVRRFYRLRATP